MGFESLPGTCELCGTGEPLHLSTPHFSIHEMGPKPLSKMLLGNGMKQAHTAANSAARSIYYYSVNILWGHFWGHCCLPRLCSQTSYFLCSHQGLGHPFTAGHSAGSRNFPAPGVSFLCHSWRTA